MILLIAFLDLLVAASTDVAVWRSPNDELEYGANPMWKDMSQIRQKMHGLHVREAVVDAAGTASFAKAHGRKPLLRSLNVQGSLKQDAIQSDQNEFEVYGTNSTTKHIYSIPSSGAEARQVQGSFKQVSIGGGMVWGVTAGRAIYKCEQPCDGSWTEVNGQLTQIDAGQSEVWGVDAGKIYKGSLLRNTGQWDEVAASLSLSLSHVSVGKGWIWGVNSNDEVYRCSLSDTSKWDKITGSLRQIDAGETEVWGVNKKQKIVKGAIDHTGQWTTVPGYLLQVSVGRTNVWGVANGGLIYRCNSPCDGGVSWVVMEGFPVDQIDAQWAAPPLPSGMTDPSAVTGQEPRKLTQKYPGKLCLKAWGLQSYYSKDYNACSELCKANRNCHRFAVPSGEQCDADSNIRLDDCYLYQQDAEKGACQLGSKPCMTTYELSDPSTSSSSLADISSPPQDGFEPDFPEAHTPDR